MTKEGFVPPSAQVIANRFGLDNVEQLPGDASRRTFFRGSREGNSLIVMAYPDPSEENLANLKASIEKTGMIGQQGVKVAQCYEADEDNVCALLEDLGEVSFGSSLHDPSLPSVDLYKMATQSLIKMREIKETGSLPRYKQTHLYTNRRHIVDYFMAYKFGEHQDEACANEYHAIWERIEESLPACPQGFVHGDYHLENIMLVKDRQGVHQGAVIDNQDAFCGPLPYDLVNLLEDARTDVPVEIRNEMIQLYTKDMSAKEKENFDAWYSVLAMHFHGRVIGLFIKFAAENGNDLYLEHVPRLQKYIANSLENPVLQPLKWWFKKVKLDFSDVTPLDGDHIRAVLK